MKGIYVIRNKIACENVTDIFTMPNDIMACISFRSFVLGGQNAAKAKNLPIEKDTHFSLEKIGEISSDNVLALVDNDVEIVACGLQEAEAIINAAED